MCACVCYHKIIKSLRNFNHILCTCHSYDASINVNRISWYICHFALGFFFNFQYLELYNKNIFFMICNWYFVLIVFHIILDYYLYTFINILWNFHLSFDIYLICFIYWYNGFISGFVSPLVGNFLTVREYITLFFLVLWASCIVLSTKGSKSIDMYFGIISIISYQLIL